MNKWTGLEITAEQVQGFCSKSGKGLNPVSPLELVWECAGVREYTWSAWMWVCECVHVCYAFVWEVCACDRICVYTCLYGSVFMVCVWGRGVSKLCAGRCLGLNIWVCMCLQVYMNVKSLLLWLYLRMFICGKMCAHIHMICIPEGVCTCAACVSVYLWAYAHVCMCVTEHVWRFVYLGIWSHVMDTVYWLCFAVSYYLLLTEPNIF